MTQAPEYTRKTITAVLEAQGEKQKGGKLAFEYQVRRQGMNFPDFITWWPPRDDGKEGPPATPPKGVLGQIYRYTVDAKSKGEGKKGEYYNLVSIQAADVPKPQGGPGAAPSGPSAPEAEAPPWEVEEQGPGRRDATRASIEKQTALKAAVELAGYHIAKGQDMKSAEVLLVASKFAAWLATGELPPVVPSSKQPAQAEARGGSPFAP